MSKNNKSVDSNATFTAGGCCDIKCGNDKYNIDQLNMYKSLYELAEKDDTSNIFTTKGRDILCFAKKVAIYAIIAYALLTLVSVKKTLDNIEGIMHNASSVNTK